LILAGDIGGTKTVIGLFEDTGDGLRQVEEIVYASQEHGSFEEILSKFYSVEGRPPVQAACLGVAGPVIDGACTATNLPWRLTETGLAQVLSAPRVKLVNDLAAMAYGMLFLDVGDFAVLNAGTRPGRRGHIAVIAAGTGLGEAFLFWDGERHHPIGTEGGHSPFAPNSEQEIGLLRFLRAKYDGHVSYERVLSGPGLYNIYEFLCEAGDEPEPGWLTEQCREGDPSAAVSKAGLAGKDPVCAATLEMFSSIYGVEAGNLALKVLSTGGVVLGGGIAPKILPVLENGSFMRGYTDKGRFSELLESMEVRVALNSRAPLIGAAHLARRLAAFQL
jgi:glucokinase